MTVGPTGSNDIGIGDRDPMRAVTGQRVGHAVKKPAKAGFLHIRLLKSAIGQQARCVRCRAADSFEHWVIDVVVAENDARPRGRIDFVKIQPGCRVISVVERALRLGQTAEQVGVPFGAAVPCDLEVGVDEHDVVPEAASSPRWRKLPSTIKIASGGACTGGSSIC